MFTVAFVSPTLGDKTPTMESPVVLKDTIGHLAYQFLLKEVSYVNNYIFSKPLISDIQKKLLLALVFCVFLYYHLRYFTDCPDEVSACPEEKYGFRSFAIYTYEQYIS